jgi:hypothetical protein
MARLKQFAMAAVAFLACEDVYAFVANDWVDRKRLWLHILAFVVSFLIMIGAESIIKNARSNKARFIRNSITTIIYGSLISAGMYIVYVVSCSISYRLDELESTAGMKYVADILQPGLQYMRIHTPLPIRLSLELTLDAPMLYFGWKLSNWLDKFVGNDSVYAHTVDYVFGVFGKLHTTLTKQLDSLEEVLERLLERRFDNI